MNDKKKDQDRHHHRDDDAPPLRKRDDSNDYADHDGHQITIVTRDTAEPPPPDED